jgi:hypothetical protein
VKRVHGVSLRLPLLSEKFIDPTTQVIK